MELRRLGATDLQVSVVGFGTSQLRLVTEQDAIHTLERAFELGINLVHVAADYPGSLQLVAKATSGRSDHIIIAYQAYDRQHNSSGPCDHFERLFESACETLGRHTLDLFGIACIDEREAFGENVWGRRGMVEFLQRKKQEGRIRATFCTTHGDPEYQRRLILSGAFDALMIAFNVLGYHALSFHPPKGRHFEDLKQTETTIFPLARHQKIGLLIMKALAGGLLCSGNAFPVYSEFRPAQSTISPVQALRGVLRHPEVSSVVTGIASTTEAEEDAAAGIATARPEADDEERVRILRSSICSRCGLCEPLCSKGLPISWIFRAAYVNLLRSTAFETWREAEYFHLHPGDVAACSICDSVTCSCPAGIPIPQKLIHLHALMMKQAAHGRVATAKQLTAAKDGGEFAAAIVQSDIPSEMPPGSEETIRVLLENTGRRGWFAAENPYLAKVRLLATLETGERQMIPLRADTHPGQKAHFVFSLQAPRQTGPCLLSLRLLGEHRQFDEGSGVLLGRKSILVKTT